MCKFAHRKEKRYWKMKLIVMTKPTFFVEEDKILANLFEEGLENLHLRNRITVHGHFYLKEEFRLRGIHIDDAHTEPPVGYKGNVSRTCHAISELKEAKKQSNYVFLHSIYDSQTNKDEKSSFTREELEAASKEGLIDKKVFALGGMNIDNVKEMKELGFGGVVICGDLWNRFNIHNEIDYKALLNHFERLLKMID